MKKIFFLLFGFCCIMSGFSQGRGVQITHYILPEFIKGTVLMKSGVKNEAMLNYNSLTEEMIFDSNGAKLQLTKLDLIDTVYITDRKFFVLNNKFVELVYQSKYSLYAEHRCGIIDPGKPAAYGGTSQTSSVTSYSSFFSAGQVYELKLPDGYKTKPYSDYWLKKDGKLSKFLSLRQLTKIFNNKESLLKDFIKKNNVKYENQESLVQLIKFMESN